MLIYALIFSHLRKHDKSMAMILPEQTIRKRHRKNVIELSGHFAHFLYVMLVTLTFGLSVSVDAYTRNNSRLLGILLALCRGFMCALQIATSQNLTRELIATVNQVKGVRGKFASTWSLLSKNKVSMNDPSNFERKGLRAIISQEI